MNKAIIMNEETKKKLEAYAKKRASEVYDIDMDELMQLVIDGAKWYFNNECKN